MTDIANTNDTIDARALIQETVADFLVKPLEAKSVVLNAAPRIFRSSEPLRIPKIVTGPAANWVGEGQKIPETAAEFGELLLMPTDRASVKTLTPVTNELIRSAKHGIAQVLQERIVTEQANTIDTALLKGDGTGDEVNGYQPTGILNQEGVQTATLDTADPDTLLDALALAAAAEATPNRWFMSGADFFALRKIKDGDGRYIMQGDGGIAGGVEFKLFDVPVTVTNKLDAGEAILADMNQVAVVRDADPAVKILDQFYGDTDRIGIRCVTRMDIGLLNPEAVVVFKPGE